MVFYNIKRVINDAKRRYRDRVESQFQLGDSRCLWQELRTVTDFRGKTPAVLSTDSSLSNNLNAFLYFKASSSQLENGATGDAPGKTECPLSI